MSELESAVKVTVNIADASITRPGFGILAILAKHGETSLDRVVTYTSLSASTTDFPSNTPVGRALEIVFGQSAVINGATPEKVKVIFRGDAESVDDALNDALLEDSDFYAVMTTERDQASHESVGAWANSNKRIFLWSSEDADTPTSAETDQGQTFKDATNNRAAGWWQSKAGLEDSITSIAVAGTVATATVADSSIYTVGDLIGIWDSAVSAFNARWTVTGTPSGTEVTFTVPSGTSPDVAASKVWITGEFVEAAIAGVKLPTDAGSSTWEKQQLATVTADTSKQLTDTGKGFLSGKNVNYFASLGGISVTLGGAKLAGGRYIDVQRGADWIETNLRIDLAELLINEGGRLGFDRLSFQKIEAVISSRMDEGLDNNFLTQFTEGANAGRPYVITMPDLSNIPSDDRSARKLTGIVIDAKILDKIHTFELTLNLS